MDSIHDKMEYAREVALKNAKVILSKYLIALPAFRGAKGFNHQTILVSAKDEDDARDIARHLKPNSHIGDIKKVDY